MSKQQNLPLVNVAIAVIQKQDGRILMAERPFGTKSAGFWEFPGGKFEPGESAEQALKRELHEEVGICVNAAYPLICFAYTYPDKIVKLHVYRVLTWDGTPSGREGQRISWEDPTSVKVTPLLPANERVLQTIVLPLTYAIVTVRAGTSAKTLTRLKYLLEQGARLIQVRIQHISNPGQHVQILRPIVNLAHRYGAKVMVSGSETTVLKSGADGLHLSANQLMNTTVQSRTTLLSASCHNENELAHAAALGANFVTLSPVCSTPAHPDMSGMGWRKFSELVKNLSMPVYALGGLDSNDLATAMRYHAYGIALSGDI